MRVQYGFGLVPRRAPEPLMVVGDIPLLVLDAKGEVTFNVPDRAPEAIRSRIMLVKDHLLASAVHAEMPVEHTLIDGVYTRKLFIPRGTLLVGKIHRLECVNIVAKGDISVLTETGCGRFQAGHIATSGPGIQKLGYAHEDTVFINVFRTDETDIQRIENEIACESYAEVELCL